MAWSNFGTGTLYYGKRDFHPSGSYLTTEFLTLFWIALFPIRTVRVKYVNVELEGLALVTSYAQDGESGRCLKQVVHVYAFELAILGFIVGYSYAADSFQSVSLWVLVLGAGLGIALLSAVPHVLRKIARKPLFRSTRV
jgi:hypothetical protein